MSSYSPQVRSERNHPRRVQTAGVTWTARDDLIGRGSFKQMCRDWIIGMSLANLALLRVWSELLTTRPADGYVLCHPPRPVDLAAAMIDVGVLAVLFCAVAAIARRFGFGRIAMQWGIVLSFAFPANAVRQVLANSGVDDLGAAALRSGHWHGVVFAGAAGACLSIGALIGWRDRLARIVAAALLVSSPFVLVTFSQAVMGIVHYRPSAYDDKKLAPPVPTGLPERRVLWVIFDEMDERLTFVNRNPKLRLPELDRFRADGFSASDAWSPDRVTLQSLPDLITGRRAATVRALAPDDLLRTYGSGVTEHWQNEPNVFSRARDAGFNTALAGWYHPYGRMLNGSLTACEWVEQPNLYNSTGNTLAEVAVNQVRSVMETSFLSPFGQSLATRHQVRNYRAVLAAATAFAADPRLGFVLVHFPVPHPPYIYDSRTGRFDLSNSAVAGYTDALALADRTLGQLRTAMQVAGVWDRTAVLLSADHGYRSTVSVDGGGIADRWVPFLLKLPGQHEHYEYRNHVETLCSGNLLLNILTGNIATPADVAEALGLTEK